MKKQQGRTSSYSASPPHTTADTQPLDISVFGPLKVHWSETCREYLYAHPGRVVTKFQFSALFRQAWSKAMTVENICSGFKKTGVYPFEPEAILKDYPATSDLPEGNSSADELDVEPAELTV